jgi:molybdopterin/thiamine biosynthesis adenylyltransferase
MEHASTDSPSREPFETWDYDTAFSRHRGLLSTSEQRRLRESCVAIPGLGGVGGIHLVTLARLGIGGFHLSDPDHFELPNFNRQCGATTRSLGRSKVDVMAAEARAINPELELTVFREPVGPGNVGAFLDGVDVVVDGLDFHALDVRRVLFHEARRRGIWALTAGPLGFGVAWLVFSPTGMSFDEYFDLDDAMDPLDQFVAFMAGIAPRATHLTYMDLSEVNVDAGVAPSAGLACQLCAGVAATEVLSILLGREPLRPVPCYSQFDPYQRVFRHGRLRRGNRGLLQRVKRRLLRRRAAELLGRKDGGGAESPRAIADGEHAE